MFMAVLYLALKEENVPRTFKGITATFISYVLIVELERDSGVREGEIRKFYKVIVKQVPQVRTSKVKKWRSGICVRELTCAQVVGGGLKASAVNPADMVVRLSARNLTTLPSHSFVYRIAMLP